MFLTVWKASRRSFDLRWFRQTSHKSALITLPHFRMGQEQSKPDTAKAVERIDLSGKVVRCCFVCESLLWIDSPLHTL
jgi:hypothetical protein